LRRTSASIVTNLALVQHHRFHSAYTSDFALKIKSFVNLQANDPKFHDELTMYVGGVTYWYVEQQLEHVNLHWDAVSNVLQAVFERKSAQKRRIFQSDISVVLTNLEELANTKRSKNLF